MKITNCLLCDLAINRTKIVSGEGVNNHIMIVGEAPGYYEDKKGTPFVGESGMHLNVYMYLFNFSRITNLYVTNIVKCRPRGNITPSIRECITCTDTWLAKELDEIRPKILVLLGNTALRTVTNDFNMNISKVRGVWFGKNNNIIATYHPRYAMSNCDRKVKDRAINSSVFTDFLEISHRYKMYYPDHVTNI